MTDSHAHESAAELQHERQTEIDFRAGARAMRLFGEWVGDRLGLPPAEREAYGKAMIPFFMEHGTDEAVLAKVTGDLGAKGIAADEGELRQEMVRIRKEARQYVLDNPA